jgi:hypothetical protein
MVLTFILISLLHATETYICIGSEAKYRCERFLGGAPDSYFYDPLRPLEGVLTLHELDEFDLANPYYNEDQDTIYTLNYSPFIESHQVPQVFTDPSWGFKNEFSFANSPIPWAPTESGLQDSVE